LKKHVGDLFSDDKEEKKISRKCFFFKKNFSEKRSPRRETEAKKDFPHIKQIYQQDHKMHILEKILRNSTTLVCIIFFQRVLQGKCQKSPKRNEKKNNFGNEVLSLQKKNSKSVRLTKKNFLLKCSEFLTS
jgi:hypothetical protein